MPDFPIIDSHLHIWDVDQHTIPWIKDIPHLNKSFSLEDYDKATVGVTVEAMVFLQCDVAPEQALSEAAFVANQAKQDPRLKGMVPFAPLEKGAAVAEDLEKLSEFDLLRGVRRLLQGEPDPEFCLRPGFIEGVKTLASFDLSFDICVNWRQMASVIELAKKCPNIPMTLNHIGKPDIANGTFEPWASQIKDLAAQPNVTLKMSGVATEADHKNWTREQLRRYIQTALEAFGFKRTMFGGDWPVASLAIGYQEWTELLEWALDTPSENELRSIYRDTATSFYRLG